MTTFYARLKPFDPQHDYVMQVFMLGGTRFDAGAWRPVSEDLADKLREVRENYRDNRSPLAFEVITEEEAVKAGIAKAAEEPVDTNETPSRSTRKARDVG